METSRTLVNGVPRRGTYPGVAAFQALCPQREVLPHLSENLPCLEPSSFPNAFPPGTSTVLDTSILSFETNGDHIVFYNDGDLTFSSRMLKHEFELFWVTDDIEILDFLACFREDLPG